MLNVADALARVLSAVTVSSAELTPLDQCLNLLLATDLKTPHDSPPFDKSMMDGFALNTDRTAGTDARVVLKVLETITAGSIPTQQLTPGTAARIMTGAPMPSGADCVVPIEKTLFDESKPDRVSIHPADIEFDRNVLRQGVSARQGTMLMSSGTVIQPQHIAVLAEFGMAQIPVFRRPTVSVLATGDELVPVSAELTPGRIRNSNEPMLAAQIARANAVPVPLGVARDNRDDLRTHISHGLKSDFLLLSGGVSAGTLDLVPSELEAAGVRQIFHKIDMKPGKPLWFGVLDKPEQTCWVFGLPGNPVSSMICFELFVRSAIRRFSGWKNPAPQTRRAVLTETVIVKGDRLTYFPCALARDESKLLATPVAWGGSADLRSTADANGMCPLPPAAEPYQAGASVDCISWC